MISDDLRTLAKWFTKQRMPIRAETCTEAASEFDIMTAQVANAAATSDQQNATIATLQGEITDLQQQLIAEKMNILSVTLLDTHLHGFASKADSDAFLQQNPPAMPPVVLQAVDFTWHPLGSVTPA